MDIENNSTGLLPKGSLRLDRLGFVRAEMARLYRLSLAGKLDSRELWRLTSCLDKIGNALSSEALERIEAQIAELDHRLGGNRRPGSLANSDAQSVLQ